MIKNPKLGGTYRAFGSPGESPDENDTDDAIIDLIGKGITQNAYQTLKHAGTFDNQDNLGADRFTDANGVKDTVNTGSSTVVYYGENNVYGVYLEEINLVADDVVESTTNYTVTGTIQNRGFFSTIPFTNGSGSANNVTVNVKRGTTLLASKTVEVPAGINEGINVDFNASDYSDFFEASDTFNLEFLSDINSIRRLRDARTKSSGHFTYSSQKIPQTTNDESELNYVYVAPNNTKLVIDCPLEKTNSNLLSLYTDGIIEQNGNITIYVTDGTLTTTSQDLTDDKTNFFIITSFNMSSLQIVYEFVASEGVVANVFGYSIYIN